MRKKTFCKKLNLNKTTISRLNSIQMGSIFGAVRSNTRYNVTELCDFGDPTGGDTKDATTIVTKYCTSDVDCAEVSFRWC